MIDQWAGILWQRFKDMYGQRWLALFQGDEAIETWRVTWASGLHVDADQIKHALSRIGTEFPDWPPTFGQFKALCESMPKAYVALPPPAKVLPNAERLDKFKEAVAALGRPKPGRYWTPDKVVNHTQVNLIVIHAEHFGRESQAGRFLEECKAYGCISADNRLQRPQRAAA